MDLFKELDGGGYRLASMFPTLTSQLEGSGITTMDLLTCHLNANREISQLSRRVNRPIKELERYIESLLAVLEKSIKPPVKKNTNDADVDFQFVTTGIPQLDLQLGGGISRGCITEVFGPSGCGKSHFLMQIAVQASKDFTSKDGCIYISTESQLETRRLKDMTQKPGVDESQLNSLSYIYCQDLESQDHILFTQLPTKLIDNHVKVIIIDSIAHHLRREDAITNISYLTQRLFEQEQQFANDDYYKKVKNIHLKLMNNFFKSDAKFVNRSLKLQYLSLMFRHLSRLSQRYNIAIVVANQVSDLTDVEDDIVWGDIPNRKLLLDNQIGFYSGWDKKSISSFTKRFCEDRVHTQTVENQFRSSMTSNNHDFHLNSKRHKSNVFHSIENRQEDAYDTAYDISKSEILKEYKAISQVTRKYVPTLGYHWSKYISTRIMLTKFYKPIIREKKDLQNEVLSGMNSEVEDSNSLKNSQSVQDNRKRSSSRLDPVISPHNLIKGWKIERFMKVVSSMQDKEGKQNAKRIGFAITEGGLEAVEMIHS